MSWITFDPVVYSFDAVFTQTYPGVDIPIFLITNINLVKTQVVYLTCHGVADEGASMLVACPE